MALDTEVTEESYQSLSSSSLNIFCLFRCPDAFSSSLLFFSKPAIVRSSLDGSTSKTAVACLASVQRRQHELKNQQGTIMQMLEWLLITTCVNIPINGGPQLVATPVCFTKFSDQTFHVFLIVVL